MMGEKFANMSNNNQLNCRYVIFSTHCFFVSSLRVCVCFIIFLSAKVNGYTLYCAIALQFSKNMVTLIVPVPSITKPELFYWKLCLVSQETAVFTPY